MSEQGEGQAIVPHTLGELQDVDSQTAPPDGGVLQWNAATNEWRGVAATTFTHGHTTQAAEANLPAPTSTDAAGATPTAAEFNALRADMIANRDKMNAVLAKLRGYGVIGA